MHHFVVREGQDKALGIGVGHAEGDVVMMMLAVHRVFMQIAQRVVHPAHVPFVVKAQAAFWHRGGHAGPGSGFLGHDDGVRFLFADGGVQLLQELDGLQVLAPDTAWKPPHPRAGRRYGIAAASAWRWRS
ncbi:hypothetical protein G6F24_017194 [Rhizopus arrhizus]|nr:hypothetical protein G6F24_017194 [Rhizopus arrhizus]